MSALSTQAGAASVFTFELSNGAAADPNSVVSYSLNGTDATIAKNLDAMSIVLSTATANGTVFPSATLTQYNGSVLPTLLINTFVFTNVLFTSYQVNGLLETVSFSFEQVSVTPGPNAVPEPRTMVLVMAGAVVFAILKTRRS